MKPILNLALKDLRQFFGDKGAVMLSFLVPAIMAVIFGFTFGGMSESSKDLIINIDVVDLDNSEISAKIIESLLNDDILAPFVVSNDEAYEHVGGGDRSSALIIPEGFGKRLIDNDNPELKLIYDPSDQLENGVIQGKLQQVLFTSGLAQYFMPSMIESMLRAEGEDESSIQVAKFYVNKYVVPRMKSDETVDDDEESDSSIFGSMSMNSPIKIVREQVAGKDVSSSAMYVQSIISAMVMFLLFGVSFGAGVLLREKKTGTLKRLMTSPLTVEGIMTAKLLSLMVTGLMQVYFMLIVGWLIFHLEIWSYPILLFMMAFATTLMASGLGVLLTGVARTEEQAGMLATLVILSFSAIGGAMVPRFIMPDFLKTIGVISPVSWAMDGFHNVFWYHQGFRGMILQFSVLVGFALVFLIVGSLLVRRQMKSA